MAIAVAQQVNSGTTLAGPSSFTITASITPSAGSTLVVMARGGAGSAPTMTFADSVNGSYTALDTLAIAGLVGVATAYKEGVLGSAATVTATFSTSSTNRGLIVLEITGGKVTGILDAHTAQISASTSGNMTATGAPALVVGFATTVAGSTFVAGSGFTGGTTVWSGSGDAALPENQRVTSTGTYAATYTGGSASDAIFGIIFDEAAAAGSSFVPYRRQQARQPDEPVFYFMGRRSATIQPASDNPPLGWPRRVASLFNWPEEERSAQRRALFPVSGPASGFVPAGNRRLLATLAAQSWEFEYVPAQRQRMLVQPGPVIPPTPPPAAGTIYDWNAANAAIIGQIFRGGGYPFQI